MDLHTKKKLFVLCALASAIVYLAGCSSPAEPKDPSVLPLKTTYMDYFPIGAAVSAGEYGYDSFESYPASIFSEFNSLVAENCMKPGVIQPTEANFNWEPADKIAKYAKEHGMKLRGHVLVWHNQTEDWMFTDSGTAEEKKAFSKEKMEAHINAVVGRYTDAVYCWDVVNEAIKDDWDPAGWESVYRESSPWYKAYTDGSFIVDAFKAAKLADPKAELYYNDYNICDKNKRDRVVTMINDLELTSHGLTGVGIQAHWSLSWPSISNIQKTIDVFHEMGLDVQITELDINCYDNDKSSTTKPYGLFENNLAKRYEELFSLFRKNKDKITNVTFWGVADDHTWLDTFYGDGEQKESRKNYPFLFDKDHKKKKAYYSVNDF